MLDTENEENEGDPNPCPEDNDDFIRPDSDAMEERISDKADKREFRWDFQIRLIRGCSLEPAGVQQSSTVPYKTML